MGITKKYIIPSLIIIISLVVIPGIFNLEQIEIISCFFYGLSFSYLLTNPPATNVGKLSFINLLKFLSKLIHSPRVKSLIISRILVNVIPLLLLILITLIAKIQIHWWVAFIGTLSYEAYFIAQKKGLLLRKQ